MHRSDEVLDGGAAPAQDSRVNRAQTALHKARELALLMWCALGDSFRWLAPRLWFRALVAMLLLAFHLANFTQEARTRFSLPFNSDPRNPPAFANPESPLGEPPTWPRLIVSRWDSGHYTRLAARGYKLCPSRDLRGDALGPAIEACDLSFYPTYSLIGYLASFGRRLPLDWAMFSVSLIASFAFLIMWTGRTMIERFGVGGTYLSLLAFNLFSTGFTLVTVQTEPSVLFLGLGSFLLFAKGYRLPGAIVAGAATAFRINAVAFGLAYALAVLVSLIVEQRRTLVSWLSAGAAAVLSGWGVMAILVHHWIRFKDPLLYVHAHSSSFGHSASASALKWESVVTWMMRSLERPLHEGTWILLTVIAFALGAKGSLRNSPAPERAYWYGLFFVNFGLTAYGSLGLSFAGMTRYALLSLPIFFALGYLGKKRPFALMVWLAFSFWHYREVDLCHYLGHTNRPAALQKCHATQIP